MFACVGMYTGAGTVEVRDINGIHLELELKVACDHIQLCVLGPQLMSSARRAAARAVCTLPLSYLSSPLLDASFKKFKVFLNFFLLPTELPNHDFQVLKKLF